MTSAPLNINGITLGFYPDEGDAGGTKSYLSTLNRALSLSWSQSSPSPAPTITVVGWYAQTYPNEPFTGFQLLPLVSDIKAEYARSPHLFVYEASVMPFQSWTGYTASNPTKAHEVATVMKHMLDESRLPDGDFSIHELRLRFGHEMNYYITSGLYPPPTNPSDPGKDYRDAFDAVSLACRALPHPYRERIKMFWCPNIASTSSAAEAEYARFLPNLDRVDYVGIDYYCPSPGNLDASDFVRKMKRVHDKYASRTRPFVVGETGLHFDEREGGGIEAKLRWLELITGKEARRRLPSMVGVNWFNYEKDRDYRLVWVQPEDQQLNAPFVRFIQNHSEPPAGERKKDNKVKGFWKTLLAN